MGAARARVWETQESLWSDAARKHPELARPHYQLGTAYLVYPGAVHTRFDHSIGTVHVAQRMIDAINRSFELDPAGSVQVSQEEARVVRLAALLHDVTHIPYGHNIEDQDGIFERHDSAYRYTRMLSPSRELGRVLDTEFGIVVDTTALRVSVPNAPLQEVSTR